MARSLSTSSHPYKIYVHTHAHPQDDQSLESAVIKFKCNIKMSYVPDKRIESSSVTRAYIPRHNAWDEFEHPANNLTEYFLSTRMFSSNTIPFELRNLHWKQWLHGKESVVLMSTEGIVTSILQVCQSMISKEEARKSGRKKLCLLVFIKKEVIVPHDEYLAKLNEMQEAEKKKQVLQKVEDMIKLRAQGWNYPQSVLDEMNEAIRQAGLGNSINEVLDFARRCC